MKMYTTLSLLVLAVSMQACKPAPPPEQQAADSAGTVASSPDNASPSAQGSEDLPGNVYWGDTHLHTSYSFDAGAFGNTLDAKTAYRFARGEEVTASMGLKTRLIKPLDFLVVADHSDNMGMIPDLYAGEEKLISDPMGKQFYEDLQAGKNHEVAIELIKQFSQGTLPDALNYDPKSKPYHDAWAWTVAAAETFNDPGKFTAFIGYEWTSLIKGNNMHRVVVYRDGADKGGQMVPYTTQAPYGSPNPRDLWKWMQSYEDKTGGKLLAIAHNGNLSNGIMFPLDAQYDGTPLDKDYVTTRARWEPLYEITQMKGDGETHPFLSPSDEFADYESWDFGNLDLSAKKTDDMLAGEYGRSALKRGLQLEARLGTNPYEFGLIGSTDSHTSLATTEENNFFGKMSTMEPGVQRLSNVLMKSPGGTVYYRSAIASGLAAVWAQENTRQSLFDAMERKETYASTGPRMQVRVFAGWDFTADDLSSPDFVELGYGKGVPMGGELSGATGEKSPRLMVVATKDPDGGNLDRVQIIKGWMDSEGNTHERIYDVACGGEREVIERRCNAPVGDTVDVKTATYTNNIGNTSLRAIWIDPEFDAAQRAFYYVRVLEIPTPRWTTYDAVRYGVEVPKDVPASQQERVYTSPIWYAPG